MGEYNSRGRCRKQVGEVGGAGAERLAGVGEAGIVVGSIGGVWSKGAWGVWGSEK